jgi:pimeloyl-ACP methyl ester carboxylesterase
MHFRDQGSGPCVLLLGGSPTPPEHFSTLTAALVSTHRVLQPHMPGYGQSPPWTHDNSLAHVERMLLEGIAARGISELSIVGVSLGAYRALSLAISGRVRVSSIVCLGGFASFTDEQRAALRAFAVIARSRAVTSDHRLQFIERMLSRRFIQDHPDQAEAVERYLDCVSLDVLADELDQAAHAPSLLPQLQNLTATNVFARVGALDPATPPVHSEEIARFAPHGSVAVIPDVGHLLLVEDATATISYVEHALRIAAE